ncbi:MAG: glycosyltransferase [Deltaproteobacteria bacterium]|nr:glycosyltransferase [Deltaproteobacteria bacterium]
MKFALVSHTLPPSLSGQAIMIYRLLSSVDPSQYCLLSRQDYSKRVRDEGSNQRLPTRYYHLPIRWELKRGYRFGLARVREFVNVPLGILSRGFQIARIMKREQCEAVIACTGDLVDLPAAYLASRLVRAKFYAHLFDYYSFQWMDPLARYFAQRLEPGLMRGAAGIISPNEFMTDELKRRYGVSSTVIRNPCDLSEYEGHLNGASGNSDGEIQIVYTGAIYDAHYDAFRNLIAALDLLGSPAAKLHLYTSTPASYLAERGIRGPVVRHEPQPASAMPDIQRRADILFLPLSFNSPYPEVIKTSATSKLGEYLASRRPILVHAPADCFLSWYFRQQRCGVVVDKAEPKQLAQTIEMLVRNLDLQEQISASAWNCARTEFSIRTAQTRFAALMELSERSGQRKGFD